MRYLSIIFIALLLITGCSGKKAIDLSKNSRIVLVGNNLGARMMTYGYFETEVYLSNPDKQLFIRNMCDGGDTPGFRPHSGRNDPWPFDGADQFQSELANPSYSEGHLDPPDEWLNRLKPDIMIAFFGYNESFEGDAGLETFKKELEAFITHTKSQQYNGTSAPTLAIVSPIAFQDLSAELDLPDGREINTNLEKYTAAMKEVCATHQVQFVDAYHPSAKWYNTEKLTIDGSQLNDKGYQLFSDFLSEQLFGNSGADENMEVHAAVMEKNWFWHNDYKIPNGVHVFGRRYEPFGSDNYPDEITKIREMTLNRDTAIWSVLEGTSYDLALADSKTTQLKEIETNYKPGDYGRGEDRYLYGEEALSTFSVPPGYKIELFASEKEFPDLANPVQLSFDNKGRLWVAVMPTYPHYKPGDPKPNDKLLILEDTDGDGKADKQTVFADGLSLPIGFEFASEGVYVSQAPHLKFFQDLDGDDKMDREEVLLSGFDDHDTHHAISAFAADPSGAIYMGEGTFLHTNVETSYGPVRATNGGFYRYAPQQHKLERTAQLWIPNPWGIAFDQWGQNFYAETSGTIISWMMPGSIKPRYGIASPKSRQLIEEAHRVRPTSGLEFISSRHFPDEVQGDLLVNNTIGFLGTKQHQIWDEGTGYETKHRQDLIKSTDTNFRPVDMEFAPDGSLYLVDWHNVLVGHMQHNARDPLRDHVHGRIYRITYPSRPLVTPAEIDGADLATLFENLKLPEFRSRYRTRRELRGRETNAVLSGLGSWVSSLDKDDPKYDSYRLEALWVTWGLDKIDTELLQELLSSDDFHVRAAVVRVIRYGGHQIANQEDLLLQAAADPNGRVRLEAVVAASWLEQAQGEPILAEAAKYPIDSWMLEPYRAADAHLAGINYERPKEEVAPEGLPNDALKLYGKGREIYEKEGYCITCHQSDGKGLSAAEFPPLAGSEWVLEDADRLIRLTLHGVAGPMEVKGRIYPGQVPMTPFKGMLNDEEMAAVLTYVRNSFGNDAGPVTSAEVAAVRAATADKDGFYTQDELNQQPQ